MKEILASGSDQAQKDLRAIAELKGLTGDDLEAWVANAMTGAVVSEARINEDGIPVEHRNIRPPAGE